VECFIGKEKVNICGNQRATFIEFAEVSVLVISLSKKAVFTIS